MKINNTSQLMLNQKYAHTMEPDKAFKALQSQEGDALFFSIGFDNKLYLTREISSDTHGWNRTDISTAILSATFPSAKDIAVKLFDISQDLLMGQTTMIMVATANGADHFFYAVNADNSNDGWGAYSFSWTLLAFDDKANPGFASMSISDIYLGQSGLTTYIITDIVTNAATSTVSRYFVDPTKKVSGNGTAWNQHPLPGDLQSQKISTLIGRYQTKDKVDGVYTLGSLLTDEQICYVPVYNDIQRGVAVSPTYINLPAGATVGATAMALSRPDPSQPYTDLLVATKGSLYFYSAAAQPAGAPPVLVATHPLLQNVEELHVNNGASNMIVWGYNANKQIFYLQCPIGSEAVSSSWSAPIPLLDNVITLSPFVNNSLDSLVIFAHQQQGNTEALIQLSQDPVSFNWQQRNLLVPAISIDEMYEQTTYTTHLAFTDDNNVPLPMTDVYLLAINPCSVYIENTYYKLDTENPLKVTTDPSGMLTIMQPVDALGSAAYSITAGGISLDINPMSCVQDKLSKVSSGADLDVPLVSDDGTKSNLVDSSVSSTDKDAAAKMIQQLAGTFATMPLRSPDPVSAALKTAAVKPARANALAFDPAKHRVYGINLRKGQRRFYNGLEEVRALGIVQNADMTLSLGAVGTNPIDWIETKAGDAYQWLKNKVDEIGDWIITIADDAVDFVVTIANQAYHFIAKCYADIAHAIHSLLVILESTWDKIRQWLGFIFEWADIVNTHKVFKNLLLRYAEKCVDGIEQINTDVQNAFASLESNIDKWANLPSNDDPFSGLSNSSNPNAINDPSSNWGMNHMKSNVTSANLKTSLPDQTYTDDVMNVLGDLETMIAGFEDNWNTSLAQVQELITDWPNLTITQVLQKLIGILADELLGDCEQVISLILTIFAQMLQGAIDALTAEIDFPIISAFYKKYTGDPLSILDVICLVFAIPATIIYKAANNAAPFPSDDPATQQMINAADFATIQGLCAGTSVNAVGQLLGVGDDQGIDGIGLPLLKKLVLYSAYAGCVGGVAMAILGPIKVKNPDSIFAAVASSISYLLYVAPDIAGSLKPILQKTWYADFSAVCTGIGVAKAVLDMASFKSDKPDWYTKYCNKISCWIDFVLNVLWQVPTTAAVCYAENRNKAGWLAFGGGTGFDLSGCMSPVLDATKNNPIPFGIAVGVNAVANAAWSSCIVANYYETDWSKY